MTGFSNSLAIDESPQPDVREHQWIEAKSLLKTILKVSDRACLEALIQPGNPSNTAVEGMQQLVELIQRLRSLKPDHTLPLESLLPYVQDEACEILDLLQADGESIPTGAAYILVEALVPQLLWSIARNSYTTMQLIEGVQVKLKASEQVWVSGMLRLAVELYVQTPTAIARLDLATGSQPQASFYLEGVLDLDTDDLGWELLKPRSPHIDPTSADASERLEQALDGISQALITTQPVLRSWLAGITIDFLAPTSQWQTGLAQLKLNFVFMPTSPEQNIELAEHPFIEAELLEEQELRTAAQTTSPKTQYSTTPISIVEMPASALVETTIVRLAESSLVNDLIHCGLRQELVRSLNWLQQAANWQCAVLPVVQEADRLAKLTDTTFSKTFCLLQPELLFDELIPKLLWHITRISFEGMQWLGGQHCEILQPDIPWQTGLLRWIVVLQIQSAQEQGWIDLTTRRFVPEASWQMPGGAIVQLPTPRQSVIPLAQLEARLHQCIHSAAPEIAGWLAGIPVELLTTNHEWQTGQLRLHTGLEFRPDLF